jgi:hypothetical protein
MTDRRTLSAGAVSRVASLLVGALLLLAIPASAQTLTPFYEWFNSSGQRFYSIDFNEPPSSWTYEGITGYVYDGLASGTTPLYRYYNTGSGDHLYTTNWNELGAGGSGGWVYEGISCYIFGSQVTGSVPLERWYNPTNGWHFYTGWPISPGANWIDEGPAGYVLPTP